MKRRNETPYAERPSSSSKAARLIELDATFYSNRTGVHWMDGPPILAAANEMYIRPWNDCIEFDRLSIDNLPPFLVRLRDDQVGHLQHWVAETRHLDSRRLGEYWPKTFTKGGSLCTGRVNWGPAFADEESLGGGPGLPVYEDPGLPLTWTSSRKVMKPEVSSTDENVRIRDLTRRNTEQARKIVELERLIVEPEFSIQGQSDTHHEKTDDKLAAMAKILEARNKRVRQLEKLVKKVKDVLSDRPKDSVSSDVSHEINESEPTSIKVSHRRILP